jgi:hypothetical protein
MTDYAALKVEIAKPEYAGLTDVQIAAAVNAKTILLYRDFSHRAARDALIFLNEGDWGKVVGVAEGVITAGINQSVRVQCISIREALRGGMNDLFQYTNANHRTKMLAAIDQLIPGQMSAAGKAAFVALGEYTFPLGEYWGWPGPVPGQTPSGIGDGDIAAARNWNG